MTTMPVERTVKQPWWGGGCLIIKSGNTIVGYWGKLADCLRWGGTGTGRRKKKKKKKKKRKEGKNKRKQNKTTEHHEEKRTKKSLKKKRKKNATTCWMYQLD